MYSAYLQDCRCHNRLSSHCCNLMPGIYQTLSDFEFSHRHLCFSGLQKDVKLFINLVGSECTKMDGSIIFYMAAVFGYALCLCKV
jgi:hypothetical protein